MTSVGGNLQISVDVFFDLSGFDNLTSLGGKLRIFANQYLESLSGLDNLTSVGGTLFIQNEALKDLSGLDNLTSVGGDLRISRNDTLKSLGLGSLCSVDDRLLIYDNTNLCENLAEDLRGQVIACPRGGIVGSILIEDNKTCP